tara:strand:- start:4976 stop:5722 length:747 start_codon:yes stop_codon:yes gene_type:complete
MPQQQQKTTDELFETKFSVRPTLNSPLQNHEKLDSSFLASVTDEQIDEYQEELNSYTQDVYRPLIREQEKVMQFIVQAVNSIFGSNGKESKYFHRALNKGTLLSSYFNELSDVHQVRKAVEDARENSQHSSNVALGDNDVEQLDLAIKYLIEKGFTYGEDFTTNNAVNIAKSEMSHDIATSDTLKESFVKHSSNCSDVCQSQHFAMTLHENIMHNECACGEVSYAMEMELGVDSNGKVVVKTNMEDNN